MKHLTPIRSVLLTGIFFLMVLLVAMSWLGKTIVISSLTRPDHQYDFKLGEKVNPLTDFDFNEGEWIAYLVIAGDDFAKLPVGIPQATVLYSTDPHVLGSLRDQVKFRFKDSDVATVTSQLLVFKNGKLEFESGIVIETGSQGLQSRDFGWLEATNHEDLVEVLREFHRYWFPIIWL